jgi:hypothetical protein
VKDGQPVPLSNFSTESNSSVLQHTQAYLPGSNKEHISELWALSVPFCRVILKASGLSISRHSFSVFSTLLGGFELLWFASLIISFQFIMVFGVGFNSKSNLRILKAITFYTKPAEEQIQVKFCQYLNSRVNLSDG